MPLHCQRIKEKEREKKRNIKSGKIDKKKRKMLVSKHTITYMASNKIVRSVSFGLLTSKFIIWF